MATHVHVYLAAKKTKVKDAGLISSVPTAELKKMHAEQHQRSMTASKTFPSAKYQRRDIYLELQKRGEIGPGGLVKDASFIQVLNDPEGKRLVEQIEEITGSLRRKGGKGGDPRLEKIAEGLVKELKTKFGYNYGSFYDAGFTEYNPREVARLKPELARLEKMLTTVNALQRPKLQAEIASLKKELAKFHDGAKDAVNHLGEKVYNTYAAWKAACKVANPSVVFEGNGDIANAKPGVGEWDGEKGVVYKKTTNDDPMGVRG